MFERKSLTWPIILAVTMIVLLVCLAVAWVVINVFPGNWTLLSVGSVMFACVVVGVVLYLLISIRQINLNRRQSNFIDAVTHELKSPIASLKLYLQTLDKRAVAEDQRQVFYRSMLEDVERLDQLISQLLDVARLSHRPEEKALAMEPVRVDELLQRLVREQLQKYSLDDIVVDIQTEPVVVQCAPVDLNILFRNIIDNAFKYAGQPPQVEIRLNRTQVPTELVATISDNGTGIPRHLRRRVFGRFFRIGDELERQKPGIGLGLFLVRAVVKRLRGKISVQDHPTLKGTRFEIHLPCIEETHEST
jgi:two-component system, OmpR family, phosphate regulon sensor histidine kinase PhoR